MCQGRDFKLFLLQLLFIASLFLFVGLSRGGELSETESLNDFIHAVDPKNLLRTRWNNGSMLDHCSDQLVGVKCDLHNHAITEIMLENLNLSGIIDANSLCKLPSLRVLSLAKNLIVGSIPESISNCKILTHLNLSSNFLRGKVPSSLANLKNLRHLDISNNNFSVTGLNSKMEIKQLYMYSMELSISEIKENNTNSREPPTEPSSVNQNNSKSDSEDIIKQWIPLAIGIAFFLFFVYLVAKRAATFVNKKSTLESPEDSPIKILVDEAGEEMKPAEERSELVFFVEDNEKFRIEDLFDSAADLQGQSLCSSLYKIVLKNNTILAVKRLKKFQVSFEEFRRTMRQIGNLKHPNILSLVAYHSSKVEKLLIYRYQRNGSLLTLLENYAEGKRDFPWRLRLTIANGIARGLDFIHTRSGSGENIAHGNIKLSNILLTENEEPLISEYGIQRFMDPKSACLYSSNGYQAPERKLTEQADVYSFGVILLELLTGKTVEKSGLDLPKWVKSMVREEWTGEVFDKEVNKAGKQWAFPLLNISLQCVSHVPEKRPNITDVLYKIEEILNDQDDLSFSSTSSFESYQQDRSLLHTVIPETRETPGSTQ